MIAIYNGQEIVPYMVHNYSNKEDSFVDCNCKETSNITVQPKNNARTRRGTRSSCNTGTYKLAQEVKMPCFVVLTCKNFSKHKKLSGQSSHMKCSLSDLTVHRHLHCKQL